MKLKILSFGEIIWDIYETEQLIGGAGLNFAAHCSKCGADSFIFSAVGNDELGRKAIEVVSDFNVNRDFIKNSDKVTGQCIVTLDSKDIPDFNVLENTAYDNIKVSEDDISTVNRIGFDALYFGTLIQRNPVSRTNLKKLCKECSFKEIVCDINLRKNCYDKESVEFCLENATILKISEEDETLLREFELYSPLSDSYEDISKAISFKYTQIKYIILTLGGKGAFVYSAEDKTYFTKNAESVDVVSTVGAGDSFIAGWVTSYLSGRTKEEATEIAIRLSAFIVSKLDAIPEYVFCDDIIKPVNDKVLLCDMHVHSGNSHDSTSLVEDIAKFSILNNVSVFAITDHCDIQYYQECDMFSIIKNSIEEAKREAEKFNGKVKILKGIEIGEGIWNMVHTEEVLNSFDYDVILSSVHAVRYKNKTEPYSTIDFSEMPPEELDEYLKAYFDDVLEMLRKVPCDIMAHLTCPLRYINGKYNMNADVKKYKEKICEILQYIIDNNIAMEINTSGVSTRLGEFMPDEWIVKLYKDMGGYLVTLGSDAHVAENVSKDFEKAIKLLKKYKFKSYYYYQNRKKVQCII